MWVVSAWCVCGFSKPTKLLLTLYIEGEQEARNSILTTFGFIQRRRFGKEGRHYSQGFESGSGRKSWKREERCFGCLRLPVISWLPMIRLSQGQIMPLLIRLAVSSRPTTGTIACSRPSARTTRRRFLQEHLGILTNPEHPIFKGFPTEMHTNWQWFPVIKESHPLVLDNFAKDYQAYRSGDRQHRAQP